MIEIDAMGDVCPIPVVKTLKAIQALTSSDVIETRVDNEIAVKNLLKMARERGYETASVTVADGERRVRIVVPSPLADDSAPAAARGEVCVVISASHMGEGDDTLGATLLKGFIYALSQQDTPLGAILCYNGGVRLTCEGSPAIEDLRCLAARGVEILSCGTCLDFYGLTERLEVGGVTNMYEIVERQLRAGLIVRP